MKKIIIIFSWVLCYPYLNFGQNLELQKLIEIAFKQNRELALSDQRIEMQKVLVGTSKELPKTAFELQFGNIQNPNVRDYTLGVNQSFELPVIYKSLKNLRNSEVATRESEHDFLKSQIKLRIQFIYFELAGISKLNELLDHEYKKMSEAEGVFKKRFETGENDMTDLLSIQLKLKDLSLRINKLTIEKSNWENQLKQALNQSQLPLLQYSEAVALSEFTGEFTHNPSVKTQFSFIENAKLAQKVDQNALKPSLNAGFMNQSMLGSLTQFIGVVGVNIPIFNQAQKARIDASRINTQMKEKELDQIRFQLENEYTTLESQLKIVNQQLENLSLLTLPETEKLLNLNQKKYLEGQIQFSDWYLSFNQYFQVSQEKISLEKEKNVIISKLNYLKGNV